jgi:hypothetical protein
MPDRAHLDALITHVLRALTPPPPPPPAP